MFQCSITPSIPIPHPSMPTMSRSLKTSKVQTLAFYVSYLIGRLVCHLYCPFVFSVIYPAVFSIARCHCLLNSFVFPSSPFIYPVINAIVYSFCRRHHLLSLFIFPVCLLRHLSRHLLCCLFCCVLRPSIHLLRRLLRSYSLSIRLLFTPL